MTIADWESVTGKILKHIAAVDAERDTAVAAVRELAERWPLHEGLPPGDRIKVINVGHSVTIYAPETLPNTWAVLTADKKPIE